jgi:hypothetical protein
MCDPKVVQAEADLVAQEKARRKAKLIHAAILSVITIVALWLLWFMMEDEVLALVFAGASANAWGAIFIDW